MCIQDRFAPLLQQCSQLIAAGENTDRRVTEILAEADGFVDQVGVGVLQGGAATGGGANLGACREAGAPHQPEQPSLLLLSHSPPAPPPPPPPPPPSWPLSTTTCRPASPRPTVSLAWCARSTTASWPPCWTSSACAPPTWPTQDILKVWGAGVPAWRWVGEGGRPGACRAGIPCPPPRHALFPAYPPAHPHTHYPLPQAGHAVDQPLPRDAGRVWGGRGGGAGAGVTCGLCACPARLGRCSAAQPRPCAALLPPALSPARPAPPHCAGAVPHRPPERREPAGGHVCGTHRCHARLLAGQHCRGVCCACWGHGAAAAAGFARRACSAGPCVHHAC